MPKTNLVIDSLFLAGNSKTNRIRKAGIDYFAQHPCVKYAYGQKYGDPLRGASARYYSFLNGGGPGSYRNFGYINPTNINLAISADVSGDPPPSWAAPANQAAVDNFIGFQIQQTEHFWSLYGDDNAELLGNILDYERTNSEWYYPTGYKLDNWLGAPVRMPTLSTNWSPAASSAPADSYGYRKYELKIGAYEDGWNAGSVDWNIPPANNMYELLNEPSLSNWWNYVYPDSNPAIEQGDWLEQYKGFLRPGGNMTTAAPSWNEQLWYQNNSLYYDHAHSYNSAVTPSEVAPADTKTADVSCHFNYGNAAYENFVAGFPEAALPNIYMIYAHIYKDYFQPGSAIAAFGGPMSALFPASDSINDAAYGVYESLSSLGSGIPETSNYPALSDGGPFQLPSHPTQINTQPYGENLPYDSPYFYKTYMQRFISVEPTVTGIGGVANRMKHVGYSEAFMRSLANQDITMSANHFPFSTRLHFETRRTNEGDPSDFQDLLGSWASSWGSPRPWQAHPHGSSINDFLLANIIRLNVEADDLGGGDIGGVTYPGFNRGSVGSGKTFYGLRISGPSDAEDQSQQEFWGFEDTFNLTSWGTGPGHPTAHDKGNYNVLSADMSGLMVAARNLSVPWAGFENDEPIIADILNPLIGQTDTVGVSQGKGIIIGSKITKATNGAGGTEKNSDLYLATDTENSLILDETHFEDLLHLLRNFPFGDPPGHTYNWGGEVPTTAPGEQRVRSYQHLLRGDLAYCETIAFKVKKCLVDSTGNFDADNPVQSFYFSNLSDLNSIEFIDTQVKYGKTYKYIIYAYNLVIGNQYAYTNPVVYPDSYPHAPWPSRIAHLLRFNEAYLPAGQKQTTSEGWDAPTYHAFATDPQGCTTEPEPIYGPSDYDMDALHAWAQSQPGKGRWYESNGRIPATCTGDWYGGPTAKAGDTSGGFKGTLEGRATGTTAGTKSGRTTTLEELPDTFAGKPSHGSGRQARVPNDGQHVGGAYDDAPLPAGYDPIDNWLAEGHLGSDAPPLPWGVVKGITSDYAPDDTLYAPSYIHCDWEISYGHWMAMCGLWPGNASTCGDCNFDFYLDITENQTGFGPPVVGALWSEQPENLKRNVPVLVQIEMNCDATVDTNLTTGEGGGSTISTDYICSQIQNALNGHPQLDLDYRVRFVMLDATIQTNTEAGIAGRSRDIRTGLGRFVISTKRGAHDYLENGSAYNGGQNAGKNQFWNIPWPSYAYSADETGHFIIQFNSGMHGYAPLLSYDTSQYGTAEADVHMYPSVILLEEPYCEMNPVLIIDRPPVFPDVDIVPFKGVNDKVKILLNQQEITYSINPDGLHIDLTDIELYDQYRAAQGRLAGDPIIFKADDSGVSYEIYRTTVPPETYQDFSGFLVTNVYPDAATSAAHVDTILPNVNYYYTFRTRDYHGSISIPSPIFRVQLVDDNGRIYSIVETVEMASPAPAKLVKSARRYIQIGPSLPQAIVDTGSIAALPDPNTAGRVDAPPFPINLGSIDEKIWSTGTDKIFKIRLTSKHTGKKMDLNVRFNQDPIVNPNENE